MHLGSTNKENESECKEWPMKWASFMCKKMKKYFENECLGYRGFSAVTAKELIQVINKRRGRAYHKGNGS